MENQTTSTPPVSTVDKEGNNTLMGVLSYLGPLVIIPLIMAKDNPFVKFHIKQGLVLLAINILLSIVMRMLYLLGPIVSLLELALFVLMIIGIINVFQKKQKELPLVGSLAKHVPF